MIIGSTWDECFGELQAYKERYGHCTVPDNWPENPPLGTWVGYQRQRRKNGTLSEEMIRRLDELGFVWDAREAAWEERFAELKRFRDERGHCDVPRSDYPILANWIFNLRQERKKGTVFSEERVRRLDEIGFAWDVLETSWGENFSALTRFKKEHGHCNVPQNWSENPRLGRWVNLQRQKRRRAILSEEQVRRLDELGFLWGPHESFWEEMFSALAEFRRKHGHCNVPVTWLENPRLGRWVHTQRKARKRRTLNEERALRLENIGFLWERHDAPWEEHFAKLKRFRDQHRHCNVLLSENRRLASWVYVQRQARIKGRLSEERVRRLDSLGFEWKPKKSR